MLGFCNITQADSNHGKINPTKIDQQSPSQTTEAASISLQLFFQKSINQENKTSPKTEFAETLPITVSKNTVNEAGLYHIEGDEKAARYLTRLLFKHYQFQDNEPSFVKNDLVALAEYLSRYPDAVALLHSIEHSNWTLSYKANMFQTVVSGSRMSVDSATIYFDPRAAARLKFNRKCEVKWAICVASPADALLHELLHTQTALLSPSKFLAEGGLNGVIYPYLHERNIIQKENDLYQSMTSFDGNQRPIRKNHVGRYREVGCVTCVN